MSCILRAHGGSFDVRKFLEASSLRPDTVYEKGEPMTTGKKNGSRRPFSGFTVAVSHADFSDLEGQIREAILFLDEYEEELRRLGSYSGVEGVSLDFGVLWRDASFHPPLSGVDERGSQTRLRQTRVPDVFPADLSGVDERGSQTRLRQTPVQTDVFPADLLWRAGALDIWLAVTHYLISGENEDEE